MSQTVIAESIASLNLLGYTEARPHARAFPYSFAVLVLALTMLAGIGGTIISWFTSGLHVTFSCLEATQLVNFNDFFIGTCQCIAPGSLVSVNLTVFPFFKVNTVGCDENGDNCDRGCSCTGVDCIDECYLRNYYKVYDNCYLTDWNECHMPETSSETLATSWTKKCREVTAHIPTCMAEGASIVDYRVMGDTNCPVAPEAPLCQTYMSDKVRLPPGETKAFNECTPGFPNMTEACNNGFPLPPSMIQRSRETVVYKQPCLRKGLVVYPAPTDTIFTYMVSPVKQNAYAIIDMQCINGVCFPSGNYTAVYAMQDTHSNVLNPRVVIGEADLPLNLDSPPSVKCCGFSQLSFTSQALALLSAMGGLYSTIVLVLKVGSSRFIFRDEDTTPDCGTKDENDDGTVQDDSATVENDSGIVMGTVKV